MKLSLNDYQKITLGASRVTEENGKIRFHRFSEKEELVYKERDAALGKSFSDRCRAPAGVKLRFLTDSRALKLSVTVAAATSRSYFSFDVFENGKPLGYLANFNEDELLENYTEQSFPLGKHEKEFKLFDGESEIEIYFPWSVFVDEITLELDDGATLNALNPTKRLLAYGDSITQGYDAIRPSQRYAAKIADFLGAEEINKAIGGEVFVPELVREKLNFEPEYISAAYGTNDWSTTDGKDFYENAKSFYTSLSESYPNSQIFAITPIWRANFEDEKPFGDFFLVEKTIKEITASLKNVRVISGFDLVSHERELFADLRLHPNDEGFCEYFENLSRKIGELI